MPKPWLYVTDSKLSGIGIDMVTEQQLMAMSEADMPVHLVARGRSGLPGIRDFRHPLPPTTVVWPTCAPSETKTPP